MLQSSKDDSCFFFLLHYWHGLTWFKVMCGSVDITDSNCRLNREKEKAHPAPEFYVDHSQVPAGHTCYLAQTHCIKLHGG